MADDEVQRTLDSGIKPLEVNYYQVKTASRREFAGFYTELVINSIELGVLTPSQYRNVSVRTTQCEKLFGVALNTVASDLSALAEKYKPEFIVVDLPRRVFLKGICEQLLTELTDSGFRNANKLYFEISSDILTSDPQLVQQKMKEMREKFGVRFMLGSYADAYCPTMRLEEFPFDGVLLDSSVCDEDNLSHFSVQSAIRLAGNLKMACFMNKTEEDSLIEKGFSAGCSMYILTESKTYKELIE